MSSPLRSVSVVSFLALGLALASGCTSSTTASEDGEDVASAASALGKGDPEFPDPTPPPTKGDPVTKPPIVRKTPASVTGVLSELTVGKRQSTGAGGGARFLVRTADKKLSDVTISASVIAKAGGLSKILGKRVVVAGNLTSGGSISATSVTLDASFVDPGDTLPPVTQVGAKKWLTIPCRFTDLPNADPHGPDYFRGIMGTAAPGAGDYWSKASNGRLGIDGSNVLDWQDMPMPNSFYAQQSAADRVGLLIGDCLGTGYFAAKTADPAFDFQTVDGISLAFSHNLDEQLFGGPLQLELDGPSKYYALSVLSPVEFANQSAVNRSMGLGMNMTLSGSAPLHFDSPWDVMSQGYGTTNGVSCRSLTSSFGCASVLPAAEHGVTHGWTTAISTVGLGSSATVALDFVGNAPFIGHSSIIHLPIDATHYYTIEARKQVAGSYDIGVPMTDLVIHSMDTTQYDSPTDQQALDATTRLRLVASLNGSNTFFDAARSLQITATPQSYGYSVNVTRGYSLNITSTGGTTTIGGGVSCGSTPCVRSVAMGATVTLYGAPAANLQVNSWGGCDTVINNQCTVTMNAARNVVVRLGPAPRECVCPPTMPLYKCEQICPGNFP